MKSKLPLLIALLFAFSQSIAQNVFLDFEKGIQKQLSTDIAPEANLQNFNEDGLKIDVKFKGAAISQKTVQNQEYQFIQIDGMVPLGQVGAPAVPAKFQLIAIPENSQAQVEIISSKFTEHEGFMLHPSLAPARDTEGAPEPEFKIDESVYTTNAYFPANIADIQLLGYSRESGIGRLQICPVQFNPVTGKIRTYTQITVRVTFDGAGKTFSNIAEKNSANYINLLKRKVINSSSIPEKPKNKTPMAATKELIIITHQAYIEQAGQLAQWKRQLGISTEIISDTAWTPAKIKNAIELRYNSYTPKPDYVLIIGDHTAPNPVPGAEKQVPEELETFATDNPYVCMQGASDFIPDMAKGRISVSSVTEAQVIVDKIINYEQNPVDAPDFYSNVLTCAQFQDDDNDDYADRRFCHTSENIHDYLKNEQSFNLERIYFTESTGDHSNLRYNNGFYSNGQLLPVELRSDDFDWQGNEYDITSAINSGKYLVFHRDHGFSGGSGWSHPYYTTSTMTALSNGEMLPVIFSINCHTGEYQLSNCFAEKLVRMENKGAVGVVGAAYYSFSGYNDALSLGMIDAIWSDPGIYGEFGWGGSGNNYTVGAGNDVFAMGDVLNLGLYGMLQNWGGNNESFRYQFELFHYFGDPTMKIWTDNPNLAPISATHSNEIFCDENVFEITETIPGSVVTLLQNNQIIAEQTVGEDGSSSLEYTISQPEEEITITISKHNHKPYVAELNISGNCNYPPTVQTQGTEEVLDNTATISGMIESENGEPITSSGIIYGTTPGINFEAENTLHTESNPVASEGEFSVTLANLEPATTYYARAYATNTLGTSYGEEIFFKTACAYRVELPYTIDFEQGRTPDCWQVQGYDWVYQSGGHDGHPAGAHGGSYNALFFNGTYTQATSKLISQPFNFTAYENVTLTFWHAQPIWGAQQDELSVYYRVSEDADWILLEQYTTDIPEWTEVSFELPEISDNYQLMFEATGSYGRGVSIDDIELSGTPKPTYMVTFHVQNIASDAPLQGIPININQEIIETEISGEATIELINGNYPYTIEADGYAPIEGEIVVNDEDIDEYISLTGMNKLNTAEGKIYPNPTNSQLTIDWPGSTGIVMTNLTGKIFIEKNIDDAATLDLSQFEPGIYFLQIQTREGIVTKRIIISK